MSEMTTIGPDLAKRVLQVHGADTRAALGEGVFLQPPVGHHQPAAISVDQLSSALRERNTKTVPVNGPLCSSFFTNAANPSCPLRKATDWSPFNKTNIAPLWGPSLPTIPAASSTPC